MIFCLISSIPAQALATPFDFTSFLSQPFFRSWLQLFYSQGVFGQDNLYSMKERRLYAQWFRQQIIFCDQADTLTILIMITQAAKHLSCLNVLQPGSSLSKFLIQSTAFLRTGLGHPILISHLFHHILFKSWPHLGYGISLLSYIGTKLYSLTIFGIKSLIIVATSKYEQLVLFAHTYLYFCL